MTHSLSSHLPALREKIAALEAVKCRMAHERVKMDAVSGGPIPESVPDQGYVRVGFCPKAERANRLACGHTMARYFLEQALQYVTPAARATLAVELDVVTNAIHSLDHQKGDAEKRVARLMEENPLSPHADLPEARHEVRQIEERHNACVERIDRIRRDLLVHLDALIAATPAVSPPAAAANTPSGICH